MWLNVPNLFTMIRVAMTPFILFALARGHFVLAGWLFGGAAITDLLDGAVARRFGAETKIGLYLDPVADKLLLSAIYVGLAAGKSIGWWLVAIIFGRDFWILLLGGVALQFTSFRDMAPSVWGKASTFLQIMTAIAVMAGHGYREPVLLRISQGLIIGVVSLAVVSAAEYTLRGLSWLRHQRSSVAEVNR